MAAYLDRVNVGFAALEMNRDLGFSAKVYGMGAGIFFLGYALAGIPSNLLLERVGARLWISLSMATWGVLASMMALVSSQTSFYLIRFLLGVAEAGFVPGFFLYVTLWFPRAYRGRMVGAFMAAIPFSAVVFSPLSGWILSLGDMFGLRSWQNLFVLEGVPSVLLAVVVYFVLTDRPEHATWLDATERQALADTIDTERKMQLGLRATGPTPKVFSPMAVALGFVFFGLSMSNYGILLWLPQIVKGFGMSDLSVGLITAVPFLAGGCGALLWGWNSDRVQARPLHVAAGAFLSGLAFLVVAFTSSPVVALVAISVAAMGFYGGGSAFWALPGECLSARNAAGGIALANSIGNIGGFSGPYAIGYIKDATGSYAMGMAVLCGCLLFSGCMALGVRARRRALAHEYS
jgi:ACS family tartrate transporter-like MFS transporter